MGYLRCKFVFWPHNFVSLHILTRFALTFIISCYICMILNTHLQNASSAALHPIGGKAGWNKYLLANERSLSSVSVFSPLAF
jgi:hypothetical protein